MTTTSSTPTESAVDASALPIEHPASHLRAMVVEYDRRPDRCTICPREMTADVLRTAWLSADAESFYDLAEIR